MRAYVIFRPGQAPEEVGRWYSSKEPAGTYVLARHTKAWYVVRYGSATPINTCDISKEVKTWLLLMS